MDVLPETDRAVENSRDPFRVESLVYVMVVIGLSLCCVTRECSPRLGGFLQLKGLSGGLPLWRAAYDEPFHRTSPQADIVKKKNVQSFYPYIYTCTDGSSLGSSLSTLFDETEKI